MDIGLLEHNIIVLKKTIKYLDGEVKEEVEKRIKTNYKLIDEFFDSFEEEHRTIESYETNS